MKKNIWLSILSVLFVFLFAQNLFAQRIGSADKPWKMLKTEHFDILFSAEQQDLGLYYANTAERAYQNLASVFTQRPDRIVLVINDSTDLSNGYATRIPYPIIMAYPVLVSDHDSLSEGGEWARELVTHEMTHIMQFEPANGFYTWLRPVFGSIVAPNLLLPLWWKEGMAVEMETQFSPGGRTRSNYQDATLRAIQLDHKLFTYTLDKENEILPSWPYGSRAYVFGSVFWSQFVKENKKSGVDYIAQRHGERVPFFVEQPMLDLTNRTYEMNYISALHEVEENSRVQVQTLETLQPTSFSFLPIEGQSSLQPAYSKSMQLLAYVENVEGIETIRLRKSDGELNKDLKHIPKDDVGDLVFHPTEHKLIYAKADEASQNQFFSNLYAYDLDKDKSEKIVSTDRARSPSFSDDGKKLIFVTTDRGRNQLKILNFETKLIETEINFSFKERIYSPILWDSESILYTKRLADKSQILIRYNLKSKTETQLLTNVKDIRFIKKSDSNLYFTSTENGVQNVYESKDLKSYQPVTHSLTGVWSFEVDPEHEKLWASVMTGDGFKVAETKLTTIPKKLPVIQNKIADRYQFNDISKDVVLPEPQDYEAAGYLWPHYWIPYIATASSSNGVYLQAQTSGQDPLAIHKYSLLIDYQTDINRGGFIGSYTNSAFELPFQLGAIQSNQAFGAIDNIVETKTNYLGVMPNLFNLNRNLNLMVGVETSETYFNGSKTKHWGPFTQLMYTNYKQNIFQISPEKGWGSLIRYERNQNVEGSENFDRVAATLIGFYSYGLPKHHAIMARVNGLFTFQNVANRFGTSNAATFASEDYILPQYVLRGYPINQFFGRSLWTSNTEYRFPITTLERGSGTDPYFLKNISGALVADGLAVQGYAIAEDKTADPQKLNQTFWSAGAELRLHTTIGYVLPMNFILGYYFPFSGRYSSSSQMALSLQIGGF